MTTKTVYEKNITGKKAPRSATTRGREPLCELGRLHESEKTGEKKSRTSKNKNLQKKSR